MSNLDRTPALTACGGLADVSARPVVQVHDGREVLLGESTRVRRLLPNLHRRLVGPWCFIDHYGPDDVASGPGMRVPPHPHIGLQTVSWLLEGSVHHQDSLGSSDVITPGTLGVMTAGRGIAHAENSPNAHPDRLHGVQLWVALPDEAREVAPSWQFTSALPRFGAAGVEGTVFMGAFDGSRSPGTAFSPIVGMDLHLAAAADVALPLEPDFEHTVLTVSGGVDVDGTSVSVGSSAYLGTGRRDVRLTADGPVHALLLGGAPFEEQIVMWWNFVARDAAEIERAREQWMARAAPFGPVHEEYAGDWLRAPELPAGRLRPGGSSRRPR